MRLFVALEIPAGVRENLAALIRELRPLAPQARWIRAENLHVTLKFIGETPPEKLAAIRAALSSVRGPGPIALDFRGLGFFPDEKRPRIFWADIAVGPEEQAMARLARAIEDSLEPLGIAREQRNFSAHLTLARFPQGPGNIEKLRAAARERAALSFGQHTTREFCLFESDLQPAAAKYTRLAAYPLDREES
jgi:2'-5' RNA ligase